jgi:Na+/H+-translocating membrane pyrophosphatase
MAISSSNSGGAWDNAKKYYESKKMKGTECHKVNLNYK